MSRQIRNLEWAKVLTGRPACIPAGRPRGVKAQGVKLEETLAQGLLRDAQHGVWLEYSDANGHGFAQCDFLLQRGFPVVIEAKLTWRTEAYAQLDGLYLPLLCKALGAGFVGGVVACANLTKDTPKALVVQTLDEAVALALQGKVPVLHISLTPPRRPQVRVKSGLPKWWAKGEKLNQTNAGA